MTTKSDPGTRVRLEAVACDLCGEANSEPLLELPDVHLSAGDLRFRVVRCLRCGLIRTSPRPDRASMHRFYPDDYAPFSRRGLSSFARQWLYRRNVRELARYLEHPARVVDIGAGTGYLLHEVIRAGNPNVLGIEPSASACDVARKRYGLDIASGTLDSISIEPESVDTVLLSHVLEHLPSPNAALRQIRDILTPGGTLVIWVPNAQSWATTLLGPHWMGWDVPRHLFAFTPATLHRLLDITGFAPGEIRHERNGLEWAWGVRLWLRSRDPTGRLEPVMAKLHPFIAAGATPLGVLAALSGRSGRIRVVAHKPMR